MQQLCYGSSGGGGDNVTALKEEIKERDELVAELSGDVTALRAKMEALEKFFAECSEEKEHSKKEVVVLTYLMTQLEQKTVAQQAVIANTEQVCSIHAASKCT